MFEKPTDSTPPTSSRRPSNTIGLVGLVVAILSLIGGIGWDWYKEKRSLQLELISGVTIVNPMELRPEGVQVTYQGSEVENASTLVFKLTNTGRTPILREEVRKAVQIAFKDSRVLDARIVETTPPNFMVNIFKNDEEQVIVLDFDLLNPGESITLSALVTLTGNTFTWDATSRIVGFSDLDIVLPTGGTQTKIPVSTLLTVNFASFYLIFLSGAALWHAYHQRYLHRAVLRGRIALPATATADELLSFIRTIFGRFGVFRNTRILDTLGHLPFDQPVDQVTREAIWKDIQRSVSKVWKPVLLSFVLILLAGASFSFLFGRYFR